MCETIELMHGHSSCHLYIGKFQEDIQSSVASFPECPHGTYRLGDDLKCKDCPAGFYGRFCAVMCKNTCLQNQT
jgi:hypothetical protein